MAPFNWQPTYSSNPRIPSPQRVSVQLTLQGIAEQHQRLGGEEKLRFQAQITTVGNALISVGVRHEQLAAYPLGQMDPNPRKQWHRRAGEGSRALIASELQDKVEKAAQKEARKQQMDQAILQTRQEAIKPQGEAVYTRQVTSSPPGAPPTPP